MISYYPIAVKRQIEWQKLIMAMALRSKQNHYRWSKIQLCHWYSTADSCQFPKRFMQSIIEEVFDNLEAVIDDVSNELPKKIPANIADPILNGMKTVKNKCMNLSRSLGQYTQ